MIIRPPVASNNKILKLPGFSGSIKRNLRFCKDLRNTEPGVLAFRVRFPNSQPDTQVLAGKGLTEMWTQTLFQIGQFELVWIIHRGVLSGMNNPG